MQTPCAGAGPLGMMSYLDPYGRGGKRPFVPFKEYKPQNGQQRYAQEDSRNVSDFAAGKDAEKDQKWMKLHSFLHKSRR